MRRLLRTAPALVCFLAGCAQSPDARPAPKTPEPASVTSSQASPKAAPSTSRGGAPDATIAAFVGQWTGHGRSLVVDADGNGKVVARTYQKCGDPEVSGPCDTFEGNEIKPGAVTQIKITSVRKAVDVVIADFTVGDTTLAVPPGSTGTLTLNPVRDALRIEINGERGDGYYCGPKAAPGYCGA